MWVSDNTSKLYAYKMSDKSRDSSKDYELHSDDDDPIGIWSDSVTMYVADRTDGKIYAYYAFPRLTASDFSLTGATLNNSWTHGSWYYKADTGPDTACRGPVSAKTKTLTGLSRDTTCKYTAYSKSGCAGGYEMADVTFTTIASGDRDSSKEFDTNAAQYGIWSDGTTMYVHWYSWELMKGGVQAYSLATGSRNSGKEFSLHSNNDRTEGMWSDGTTMWVSDWTDDKLYAYNLSTKSYDGSKDISLHADNG